MHNIFRSTALLIVLLGSLFMRPLCAGGENGSDVVELLSLFPNIRETKTEDLLKPTGTMDSANLAKLLKYYCNRGDCPLSEPARTTFLKLTNQHPFPMLEMIIKDAVEEKKPNLELIGFITPFARGNLEGALSSATKKRELFLVKKFLKAIKENPNTTSNLKIEGSFEEAIKKNDKELVQFFVDYGFDQLAPLPESQQNALSLAYQREAYEAAEALEPAYTPAETAALWAEASTTRGALKEDLDKEYDNLVKHNKKLAPRQKMKRLAAKSSSSPIQTNTRILASASTPEAPSLLFQHNNSAAEPEEKNISSSLAICGLGVAAVVGTALLVRYLLQRRHAPAQQKAKLSDKEKTKPANEQKNACPQTISVKA